MGDLLEECLQDLGTRRAPVRWAAVCGPLVERTTVKTERRRTLEAGNLDPSTLSRYNRRSRTNKGQDEQQTSVPTVPPGQHLALRRRDEHHHVSAAQRNSNKANREAAIQQCLAMKAEPIQDSLPWLEKESETGHVEYKYKLNPHPIRLQQLITQMKFRLSEGSGTAFYYVGVEDDGYLKGLTGPELEDSVANVHKMASSLGAHATLVRVFPGAHGRRCALLRVCRGLADELTYTDLRVAVAGCADSGKSTLVSVLTHGAGGAPSLDCGRGSARIAVLRHKHELESGRTSSLSHQLLGYDAAGTVLNYASHSALNPTELCSAASKLLTFIDMGGHEKCLKTALYGLTALLPDYVLLACSAAGGLGRMSREHLAVAVGLQIPVAVVVTKTDLVGPAQLAAVVGDVRDLVLLACPALLSSTPQAVPRVEEVAPVLETPAAARAAAHLLRQLGAQRQDTVPVHDDTPAAPSLQTPSFMVPILVASCVTGEGLDVVHAFLSALDPYGPPGARTISQTAAHSRAGTPPAVAVASAPDLTHLGSPSTRAASVTASETGGAAGLSPAASLDGGSDTTLSVCASGGSVSGVGGAGSPLPGHAGLSGVHVTAGDDGEGGEDVGEPASPRLELTEVQGDEAAHFQVDQCFEVAGVGSVVSGRALAGCVRLGQRLLLGPTTAGDFTEVTITSIQRAHVPVQRVRAGQCATLALSPGVTTDDTGSVPDAAAVTAAVCEAAASSGTAVRAAPVQHGRVAGGGRRAARASRAQAAAVDADDESPWEAADGSTGAAGGKHTRGARATNGSHVACASRCDGQDGRGLVTAVSTGPGVALSAETVHVPDDLLGLFAMDSEDELPARQPVNDATGVPGLGAGNSHERGGRTQGHVGGAQAAPQQREREPVEVPEPQDRGEHRARGWQGKQVAQAMGGEEPSTTTRKSRGSRTRGVRQDPGMAALYAAQAAVGRREWRPSSVCAGWHGEPSPSSSFLSASVGAVSGPTRPQASSPPVPSTLLLGSSPSASALQGAVLLCPALQPRTVWGFEAVLVLLGGHWPARGLLSGCWPPMEAGGDDRALTSEAVPASVCEVSLETGDGVPLKEEGVPMKEESVDAESVYAYCSDTDARTSAGLASAVRGSRTHVHDDAHITPAMSDTGVPIVRLPSSSTRDGPRYTCVVHCANVRQQARLLRMQELHDEPGRSRTLCSPAVHVSPCMRAAAALLHAPWQQCTASGAENGSAGLASDLGCIVRATFRFEHRPEWLVEGSRLVIRDRSTGHVSGAGYVRETLATPC